MTRDVVKQTEKTEKECLPIVPSIVPTGDVSKRTLSMFILAPLDEGDLFPQLVPELCIVRVDVQTVVVHRQIKVGEKQLAEVEQPDVDIATVRAFNRLNRT